MAENYIGQSIAQQQAAAARLGAVNASREYAQEGACEAAPEKEITVEFHALDHKISNILPEIIDELERKLALVLRDAPKTTTGTDSKQPVSTQYTHMGRAINTLYNRLYVQLDRLGDLIARCEL